MGDTPLDETRSGGPLAGLRVIEFASIGPGPYCAMLLADLGAEILRIDRPGGNGWPNPIVDRGRSAVEIDIRTPQGRERALDICANADVLIEGLRPGVMERLGLGPDVVLERNPLIIYGRLTGWGQEGPLAQTAGHDINYIALTGALAAIGRPGEPAVPPLNLVGDLGGGSLLLAFGIVAAIYERTKSNRGQVIDAAIVDGVSSMMGFFAGMPRGTISLDRRDNILAGAAPHYRCYLCADGLEISIGAIEPQFYTTLLKRLGLEEQLGKGQNASEKWAERSELLEKLFLTRSRAEWCELLEGTEACFAPVLSLDEAANHPHLRARGTYVNHEGRAQVAPVPRFSRTPGAISERRSAEDLIKSWSTGRAVDF
jgi:alpha-methylacyl-CoA racemase